jgi:FkbM family methyltransferase
MNRLIQILINLYPTSLIYESKLIRFFFKIIYFAIRPFFDGPFVIKTKFFLINAYPLKNEPSSVYFRNFHDFEIINKICKMYNLDDKILFFDIGANIGSYSLAIANNYKNSKCYGFEPVQKYLKQFSDNIKLNQKKNIIISNNCISDSNLEKIDFFVSKELPGGSGLNNNLFSFHPKIKNKNDFYKISCKSMKLDEFEKKEKLNEYKNILIKIDVEGAEKKVLIGGQNLIIKFKPDILVEIEERNFEKENNVIQNLKNLESLGYKIYRSITEENPILSTKLLEELSSKFKKQQAFHLDLFLSIK